MIAHPAGPPRAPRPPRPGHGGAQHSWRPAAAALLVWVALVARASAASLDDQVYAIARQLMCPVCVGQTVAESDSALAREMRAVIRRKLEAGETPPQILRYFVGQFGDSVLAEPRPRGISLILYAGPPLALVAGGIIALMFIRRSRIRPGASPDDPPRAGGIAGADDPEP